MKNNRVIKMVDISRIEVDRYPMNPSTLSLIRYLESGGEVPPIKLAKLNNGKFQIRDGRHRLLANKLLGNRYILARYSERCLVK